jgi:hypothetical protein
MRTKSDNILVFNKSVLRNTGLVAFDPTKETEIPRVSPDRAAMVTSLVHTSEQTQRRRCASGF